MLRRRRAQSPPWAPSPLSAADDRTPFRLACHESGLNTRPNCPRTSDMHSGGFFVWCRVCCRQCSPTPTCLLSRRALGAVARAPLHCNRVSRRSKYHGSLRPQSRLLGPTQSHHIRSCHMPKPAQPSMATRFVDRCGRQLYPLASFIDNAH